MKRAGFIATAVGLCSLAWAAAQQASPDPAAAGNRAATPRIGPAAIPLADRATQGVPRGGDPQPIEPATAAEADAPDTLVLCPDRFRGALQPWIDYRQGQGYRVLVERPAGSAYAISQQVRRNASGGTLRHLMLVGDATADAGQASGDLVATDYRMAKVIAQYGGQPDLATDNAYADTDGDGWFDLTVGRLPVDTPEQLVDLVRKIIDYETRQDGGAWRGRINVVGGAGNFDPLIDRVIENTSRQLLTDLIPPSFETSVTMTNWKSGYCPFPPRVDAAVVERLNEGCLFWVYIGHGLPTTVARLEAGGRLFPVLDTQRARAVRCARGYPIALFLSCYSGAFDGAEDCLAEALIRQPCGPVASLCGTRMTMPYGMAALSYELMRVIFQEGVSTLGEAIRLAKNRLRENAIDSDTRQMIESLAESFSPTGHLLPLERDEHAHLFHLLGDPLLRVALPGELPLQLDAPVVAGGRTHVSGAAPAGGQLTIELSLKRDRMPIRPPRRKVVDLSPQAAEAYDECYRRCNDLVCRRQTVRVAAGAFSAELEIPADASGEYVVRGFLESDANAWFQAIPVTIR